MILRLDSLANILFEHYLQAPSQEQCPSFHMEFGRLYQIISGKTLATSMEFRSMEWFSIFCERV